MSTEILIMISYVFFNSIATYEIIAWGGAYYGKLSLLQLQQKRILRIVSKNTFLNEKKPLSIDQAFIVESLQYHYNTLKGKYLLSNSRTRNKILPLPKLKKTVGFTKFWNKSNKNFQHASK